MQLRSLATLELPAAGCDIASCSAARDFMDETLRQIADQTAGVWLDYREGEVRADRATGRKAAGGDIELLPRRHTDFEDSLVSRAKAAILGLRDRLASHSADLQRQVADLNRECDEEIGQKLQECRQERQLSMDHLDRTIGPRSAGFQRAAQTLEEAEKSHRAIRAQVDGRPLRRSLVRTYLPFLILLALIEIPVNRLAFELFFQEQPAISLGLALAVGLILMFFAHLVGLLLRRMEHPSRPAVRAGRAVTIVLLLGLVGALMYVLAGMRQLYVQLLQSEGASLQDQIQQLTDGGAASALKSVAGTGLGTAGWTLLLLNVALFTAATMASFFRHDPHPDYESAWRGQERARRRLTAIRGRYEAALGKRSRDFGQRQAALEALLRETQARRDQLAGHAAAIGPFYEKTLARIVNTVRSRSLAFVEGAIGALPIGAASGAGATLRAMSEATVHERIAVTDPVS